MPAPRAPGWGAPASTACAAGLAPRAPSRRVSTDARNPLAQAERWRAPHGDGARAASAATHGRPRPPPPSVSSAFSHLLNLHNLSEEISTAQHERAIRMGEVGGGGGEGEGEGAARGLPPPTPRPPPPPGRAIDAVDQPVLQAPHRGQPNLAGRHLQDAVRANGVARVHRAPDPGAAPVPVEEVWRDSAGHGPAAQRAHEPL